MDGKIDQLFLPKHLKNYSVEPGIDPDKRIISGLSHINFFVGPNNSGKSRLLRKIATNDGKLFRFSNFPKSLDSLKSKLLNELSKINSKSYFEDIKDYWWNLEYNLKSSDPNSQETQLKGAMDRIGNHTSHELRTIFRKIAQEFSIYIQSQLTKRSIDLNIHRIYIPTLRGLRPLLDQEHAKNEDIYAKRTKLDYFGTDEQSNEFKGEIYTGLTFYKDLRNLLLGDHEARQSARDFEAFLSRELFGGDSVTLIPRESKDVVYFKLSNTEERPIYSVGDGLQHLIILTFPLFKNRKKPSQVFIEEPELFLHPGMQRALIKAMRTFDNHQFFIATHSNHLLDLTLEFDEISIYTLSKKEETIDSTTTNSKFYISLVSSHDFRVLEILGTRSSSVFLSNCTIWVEGITDRRYLTHYLRLYIEQLEAKAREDDSRPFIPRQDLHYSFVEYSGGNITHWSFLDQIEDPILVDRLCAKAMLITDQDKGKETRHQKLKEKLGDDYYCLECSEIENLLTPEVLRKVLVRYGEDDGSIKKFTQEQYVDKKLGKFLETRLSEKKRTASYAMTSGTISDKIEFCERAIEAMPAKEDLAADADASGAFRFDQLSDETQRLTMKLYQFIATHNRR